jgi:hypothetical protein
VLRAHRKYARPSTTTISPSRSANAPFSIWYRAHFRIDLGDADAVSYGISPSEGRHQERLRKRSANLATLVATRRASSRVRSLAAARRPGSSSK